MYLDIIYFYWKEEIKDHPGILHWVLFSRILFIHICISYDTVSKIIQNFSLKKFRIIILKNKNIRYFDNTLLIFLYDSLNF